MANRPLLKRFADAAKALAGRPPTVEVAGIGTDDAYMSAYRGDQAVIEDPDITLSDMPERNHPTLYDFYAEMLRKDGHLRAMFAKRKTELLKRGWRIEPASEMLRDRKRAEWVEQKLHRVRDLDHDLEELLDAIAKGMAISEVMWKLDGSEVVIDKLLSRRQRRFAFDRQGRLLLKARYFDFTGEPVPDRKFLHFAFAPEYENPYGMALCAVAAWPYWFKRHGVRFWALYNEKRAFPPAVGKYPVGTKPEDRDKLLQILRTLQAETGITIPDNVTLEFLELTSSVALNSYSRFIELMDTWETKIVLHEELTTSSGKPGHLTGSGPSKEHRSTADALAASDGKAVAAVLNTLIVWLVDFNFAAADVYPTWRFNTEPEENLKDRAELDAILHGHGQGQLGIPVAGSYWYETYGRPEPTEDDPAVDLGPAAPPPPDGQPPFADDPELSRLFSEAHTDTNRLLTLIARDIAGRKRG